MTPAFARLPLLSLLFLLPQCSSGPSRQQARTATDFPAGIAEARASRPAYAVLANGTEIAADRISAQAQDAEGRPQRAEAAGNVYVRVPESDVIEALADQSLLSAEGIELRGWPALRRAKSQVFATERETRIIVQGNQLRLRGGHAFSPREPAPARSVAPKPSAVRPVAARPAPKPPVAAAPKPATVRPVPATKPILPAAKPAPKPAAVPANAAKPKPVPVPAAKPKPAAKSQAAKPAPAAPVNRTEVLKMMRAPQED